MLENLDRIMLNHLIKKGVDQEPIRLFISLDATSIVTIETLMIFRVSR
jgi:hypothetical protein